MRESQSSLAPILYSGNAQIHSNLFSLIVKILPLQYFGDINQVTIKLSQKMTREKPQVYY